MSEVDRVDRVMGSEAEEGTLMPYTLVRAGVSLVYCAAVLLIRCGGRWLRGETSSRTQAATDLLERLKR